MRLARSNQETDAGKNASPCLTQKAPYKGRCVDTVEKHEPASDIGTAAADSLIALDPNRPSRDVSSAPNPGVARCFRAHERLRSDCLLWIDELVTSFSSQPP